MTVIGARRAVNLSRVRNGWKLINTCQKNATAVDILTRTQWQNTISASVMTLMMMTMILIAG